MPLPVEFRGSKYPAHYQFISQYENGKIKEMTQVGITISYMEGFAKAIWGEGEWVDEDFNRHKERYGFGKGYYQPLTTYASCTAFNWQYHIQQAVISEDPLQYYWENLPTKDKEV